MKSAALLVLIGCAHGMPRADPRCDGGDPLFQGDAQRDGRAIRVWISTAGAWAYQESDRSPQLGCLDRQELTDVDAALARATWTKYLATDIGPSPVIDDETWCRDKPVLRYYVHGQLVLTVACGWPDDATAAAILEIFGTINLARG